MIVIWLRLSDAISCRSHLALLCSLAVVFQSLFRNKKLWLPSATNKQGGCLLELFACKRLRIVIPMTLIRSVIQIWPGLWLPSYVAHLSNSKCMFSYLFSLEKWLHSAQGDSDKACTRLCSKWSFSKEESFPQGVSRPCCGSDVRVVHA